MLNLIQPQGGPNRGWFDVVTDLLRSPGQNRTNTVKIAATIWLSYPTYAELIECSPSATADERHTLRDDLDFAHYVATQLLAAEAERLGLNCVPLIEEHRLCLELFKPIRQHNPGSTILGVEWFHHYNRNSDEWPECLGDWRYTLTPAMQDAIRAGEEVFCRLLARLSIESGSDEATRSVNPTITVPPIVAGGDDTLRTEEASASTMSIQTRKIYEALKGKCLLQKQLQMQLDVADPKTVRRNIKTLIDSKLVVHLDGGGYYRPDAPPPDWK